ncbi:MAG: hypothetical protein ACRDLS_11970 [Solirubrobacteraceae bacterium]
MTERGRFEREVIDELRQLVAGAAALAERGVVTSEVELTVVEHGDTEVRLYAYRDGQISDVLEAHVWRDGRPAASLEDLREWFAAQLETFG